MRLTKEDKYGHFYTNKANCRNIWSLDGKKLEGEFFENQTLAIDGEAIDKLGQLEDIEEELGIDLMVLFKALKNGIYASMYGGKPNNTFNEIIFIEPKSFKLCTHTHQTCLYYEWGWPGPEANCYYLNDYGKSWALTEEELLC